MSEQMVATPTGGVLSRRGQRIALEQRLAGLRREEAALEAQVEEPPPGDVPPFDRMRTAAALAAKRQEFAEVLTELAGYLRPGSLGQGLALDAAAALRALALEWHHMNRIAVGLERSLADARGSAVQA